MNLFLHIWIISVFIFIGFFHVYWAFGGRAGIQNAIPSNKNGMLFQPDLPVTLFIAVIFFTGSVAVLLHYLEIEFFFLQKYLFHFIIFVFTARAIGEFKYVGFFKKVKYSSFSKYDTFLYLPLCISIATSAKGILLF